MGSLRTYPGQFAGDIFFLPQSIFTFFGILKIDFGFGGCCRQTEVRGQRSSGAPRRHLFEGGHDLAVLTFGCLPFPRGPPDLLFRFLERFSRLCDSSDGRPFPVHSADDLW